MKAFADDKLEMAEIGKLVLDRVENIVGNGENAGNHHFVLFLLCYLKAAFPGSGKPGIVCGKGLTDQTSIFWTGPNSKQQGNELNIA